MKQRLETLLSKWDQGHVALLIQFVKFGLVGVSNTLISYSIDMMCYYVILVQARFRSLIDLFGLLGIAVTSDQMRIVCSSMLGFVIGVTNSFILNNRFVFNVGGRQTAGVLLKKYLRTVACYALTGLVISPLFKLWLGGMMVPFWGSSLLALIITVPLNFLLNKFWAFRASAMEK